VVDLTVKNLAMSTAMCVLHNRNQEANLLDGSLRVQSRSLDLLRQLDSKLVKVRLEKLLSGLEGHGDDQQFLEKWGYDAEQRNNIKEIIMSVSE
jgi:lysyl-tRNA synthetase class II